MATCASTNNVDVAVIREAMAIDVRDAKKIGVQTTRTPQKLHRT
jgi:hypothetical protein